MIKMENTSDFYTVKGYQTKNDSRITAAAEDYLEMIYRHSQVNGFVRINFLAASLNVNPSSASKMVMHLKQQNLVEFEKYGLISLTNKGVELGEYLLYRHNVLHRFLCKLNGTENELKQAELIEHYLNRQTVYNIDKLIQKMDEYEKIRLIDNGLDDTMHTIT